MAQHAKQTLLGGVPYKVLYLMALPLCCHLLGLYHEAAAGDGDPSALLDSYLLFEEVLLHLLVMTMTTSAATKAEDEDSELAADLLEGSSDFPIADLFPCTSRLEEQVPRTELERL